MDDHAWSRIETVLEQALELPPDEVDAFLDVACAGDPALRDEVESLIAADRTAPALLDRRGFTVAADPEPDPAGDLLGPYRILREIGRGGMSTVFEGERTEPFEQAVAVKILHRDASADDLAARVHTERQILASLDHRGIVRILDGGLMPDGRPYLVMDRIDGERIDEWCDRRRLTIPERLRLFRQVLDAVAYAHRALVVHRDLKPANILVTEAGEVRLLDFGIARIVDADGGDVATRTARRALTPEYAAPEQVRGERITTACDIYTLGVLLYELLAGERPYRLESPTPWEVERAVLETEPQRPSAAVVRTARTTAETAESIAHARRTEPDRLCRVLDGDLDAIVLKAMRKAPVERYPSADALADDVERYLGSLPVNARRGSRGYRARKFVARHRAAVGVGAAVLLFALAGVISIVSAWGTAERARQRAEQEARTATEVSDFLVNVFGGSDPMAQAGDTVTARTLLERGRDRIREHLRDEPVIRASMLAALGEVYSSLGRHETADTLLREALGLRTTHPGADALEVAETLRKLAENAGREADFPAAAAYARQGLSANAAFPENTEQRAALLGQLAEALRETAPPESARIVIADALRLDRAAGDSSSAGHLERLLGLATILRAQEQYDSAADVYRAALPSIARTLGREHSHYGLALNNAAFLLTRIDRAPEAVPLYEEALEIQRAIYGPDHPAVWLQQQNLGAAYVYTDRLDDAIAIARERAASIERAYPAGHWRVGSAHEGLGELLLRDDRFAEAETEFRTALASFIDTIGLENTWTRVAEAWAILAITLQGDARGPELLDRSIRTLDGMSFDGDKTADVRKIADHLEAAGMTDQARAFRALVAGG